MKSVNRITWRVPLGLGVAAAAALLLGGLPFSEGPDFLLDTALFRTDPAFGDGGPFDMDTWLTFNAPGYAQSPGFAIDTYLSFDTPPFESSAAFALDTTRINRVWGDSDVFTFEGTPTPCFTDDFNRPDGLVGNGWSNTTENIGGNLVIRNGALSTPGPSGQAGVFRPIDLSGPVTVSAILTHMNGYSGLLNRYSTIFAFGSTGDHMSGYRVIFGRGDQNYTDSAVNLSLNGVAIASIPSSFQFGATIRTSVTFSPDGSVVGSVTGDGHTFSFSAGSRPIALPGSNFAIIMSFPDSRSSLITNATLDDFTILSCGGSQLTVAPSRREVGPTSGTTTFTVSNTGGGTMHWTASVVQGADWLEITSGAAGANSGTIHVGYDANAHPEPRVGTIRVSAPSAAPNQADVSIRQPGIAPPEDQCTPDSDLQEGNEVTLDHLWEWDDDAGRFVRTVDNTVTIDPDEPTYLLTHGWDGVLDGARCGSLPNGSTCSDLNLPSDDPHFAMSSIGSAIRRARPRANLLAWDWAENANPNGCCDLSQLFTAPGDVADAIRNLLRRPTMRGVIRVIGLIARDTICQLSSAFVLTFLNDAYQAGLKARAEGIKLGTALADQLDHRGGSLGTELHFIGKSHGGGVLGRAASILKQRGHAVDSLTTLDTPHVFCVPGTDVCYIDSLRYVEPDAVSAQGQVAVLYYPDRLSFGFGASIASNDANLTNIALNSEHVPPSLFALFPVAHDWIAGNNDCECPPPWMPNACLPDDGWFPLSV